MLLDDLPKCCKCGNNVGLYHPANHGWWCPSCLWEETERLRKRVTELEARVPLLVAERLLTNGAGQRGQRLAIELDDGRDGGGWCHAAIVQQVVEAILAAEAAGGDDE